jgi:hypothetical protein
MVYLIAALFFGIIGAVIGSFHSRSGAGFWLGLLLGPIGWIIVLLIGRADAAPTGSLSFYERDEARRIARQRQQDEQRRTERLHARWRIAKGTTDLGEMDLAGLKLRLTSGELTLADLYFHADRAEWRPLSELGALHAPASSAPARRPSGVRYDG